jgi:hypothetical protein
LYLEVDFHNFKNKMTMKGSMIIAGLLLSILVMTNGCNKNNTYPQASTEEWQALFNGKDLTGWTPKINGYTAGDNHQNTFSVKDSAIVVDYKSYDKFDMKFGHLMTNEAYGYYKIKLEYKFEGKHLSDAPIWAANNSGIMLHSQSAQSMAVKQGFPVSAEFQFLCNGDSTKVTTGNLCTPGTYVKVNGTVNYDHVINSHSKSFAKGIWMTAEAIVYGDSLIHHLINGDTVLTYTDIKLGRGFINPDESWKSQNILDSLNWIKQGDKPLSYGHIALQAESQPVSFRKIQLLNLEGCMDKKAKNYKTYFVKHKIETCRY